jgi:hypothetical protein
MPPGPVYNWLAVAHSALVILDHALQHRVSQVTRVGGIGVPQGTKRARDEYGNNRGAKDVEEPVTPADESLSPAPTYVRPSSLLHANEAWLRQLKISVTPTTQLFEAASERQLRGDATGTSTPVELNSTSSILPASAEPGPPAADTLTPASGVDVSSLDAPPFRHSPIAESDAPPNDVFIPQLPFSVTLKSEVNSPQALVSRPESSRLLQSSKVPSSRIGRLFHYGGATHNPLARAKLGLILRRLRPRSSP